MEPSSGEILALSAVSDSQQAKALARSLVEARLAACVTCLPGAMSFFRWQSDAVTEESEVVLLIKTHRTRLAEIEAHFRENHPYECAELIVFDMAALSPAYAKWLRGEMHLEPLL